MTPDSDDLFLLPTELRNLASSKRNLEDIVQDRRLAKIGDALLNLLNVLARVARYVPEESKVSNRMLKEVSERAGLRGSLKKRLKQTEIGNAVEALMAYWYIKGEFSGSELLEESKKTGRFDSTLVKIIQELAEEEGYTV